MKEDSAVRKAQILVVDDHPLFREGVVQLIDRQHDLTCCGQAGDRHTTMTVVNTLNPDLVLLDLRLGQEDGLELIKGLRALRPKIPILVLSQHDETLYAERVLRAGAKGFLMKEQAADEVLNAIRSILRGELYVSRRVAMRVLDQFAENSSDGPGSGFERLSDRELHVFNLLGAGLSTREIANRLNLSFKTIQTHRENIKQKLGLTNATELVHYATNWVNRPSA